MYLFFLRTTFLAECLVKDFTVTISKIFFEYLFKFYVSLADYHKRSADNDLDRFIFNCENLTPHYKNII